MIRTNKTLFAVMLLIAVVIGTSLVCHGNAMEPPSIVIIVPNAPNDLEIIIENKNESVISHRNSRGVEAHFNFYVYDLRNTKEYSFIVKAEDIFFEVKIDEPLEKYHNIYTLDLKRQTLIPGKLLSRTIMLVVSRVILTILIEALIFFMLGFRKRKSWVIFMIINLITQGYLNIWLAAYAPFRGYAIILYMLIAEIIILITELIAFLFFAKEHTRRRRALFVVFANIVSFIAGGYLITYLPL